MRLHVVLYDASSLGVIGPEVKLRVGVPLLNRQVALKILPVWIRRSRS